MSCIAYIVKVIFVITVFFLFLLCVFTILANKDDQSRMFCLAYSAGNTMHCRVTYLFIFWIIVFLFSMLPFLVNKYVYITVEIVSFSIRAMGRTTLISVPMHSAHIWSHTRRWLPLFSPDLRWPSHSCSVGLSPCIPFAISIYFAWTETYICEHLVLSRYMTAERPRSRTCALSMANPTP